MAWLPFQKSVISVGPETWIRGNIRSKPDDKINKNQKPNKFDHMTKPDPAVVA